MDQLILTLLRFILYSNKGRFMPEGWEALFGFVPHHYAQANNPHFGKKRSRNNWDQRKEAFKKRVEKRRAKKKR